MKVQPAGRLPRRAAACVVVLTALVAACSSSPSHTGGTTAAASTKTMSTYGVATGDLPTLTWDLPYGEPNTIDPPNTAFYSSSLIAADLCDPLLRLNPNYSLSPDLATSLQYPNSTTLVFTIRSGV